MDTSYKIMVVITRADIGGAQNHIEMLTAALPSCYRVFLCTGSGGPLIDKAKSKNMSYKVMPALQGKYFFSGLFAMWRCIRQEKPDLIHTHSAIASFIARIAGGITRTKTLYTVHGWSFVPTNKIHRRAVGWLMEVLAKPFTSGWILVSDYDYRLGIQKRVIVKSKSWRIPNGIFDDTIVKSDKSCDQLNLVFIGRASFQKNSQEAIKIISSCDSKVTLTMYVTSGEDLALLESDIEKYNLSRRVNLIKDNPNASKFLHTYDALLLTSRYEAMPLCVLEAMRSGLPVLSTDICGMAEVVKHGETGFLYPLFDVQQAVNYIQKLMDVECRLKMGAASRQRFLTSHTAQLMAQRTAEVYKKLLSD